ncbi:MAG: flagellar hook-length control protein FliK [Gammaproteobacteria bacterium]|nr:flagellar hook-length control protein FliK [Gammaproteobacteria bacterium]
MQEGASTITNHALPGFLMPPLAQESFPGSEGSAFFSHLLNQAISSQGYSQEGLEVKYHQQLDKVDLGFDWNAHTPQQSPVTDLNKPGGVDEQRLSYATERTPSTMEVALNASGSLLPPAQQSLQTNESPILSEAYRVLGPGAGSALLHPQSTGQPGPSVSPRSVTEQNVPTQVVSPASDSGMSAAQVSLLNESVSRQTADVESLNYQMNNQTEAKAPLPGVQVAVQGNVASGLTEAETRIEAPFQSHQAHRAVPVTEAPTANRQNAARGVAIPPDISAETTQAEIGREHPAESLARPRQPGGPGATNTPATSGVTVALPESMMKAGQPEYTANSVPLSGDRPTSAGWEPGFRQIIPTGNPVNGAAEPVAAAQNVARMPESPQAQSYINQNGSQLVSTGPDHNQPGHSASGLTADNASQSVFDVDKVNTDLRATAHESARSVSQPASLDSLSSLGSGKVNDSLSEIGSTRSDTQRVPHFNLPVSVNHKAWSDAFSQRVQWLASNSVNQAEIRLDPPQLGKVDVQIDISGPEARVIFNVEHAQAKEALDNALPRLRDMMNESGFQQLDVGVGQNKGQAQSELAERDSNRSPGTGPSTRDGGVDEQLAVESAPVIPGTIQDGVDIYA